MNKPNGAFYFTVMFKPGVLGDDQRLRVGDPAIEGLLGHMVEGVEPDSLPSDGRDDAKRAWIFSTLRRAIDEYASSAPLAQMR